MTLQDLLDYARLCEIDPKQYEILIREECANGDLEFEFLEKPFTVVNAKILDDDDGFDKVPHAITLQKRERPDFFST